MSLYKMTMYRVKKVLAWVFAIVIIVLLAAGVYFVAGVL